MVGRWAQSMCAGTTDPEPVAGVGVWGSVWSQASGWQDDRGALRATAAAGRIAVGSSSY